MELIIFLVLLALGFGFGRYAEKRHYDSIIAREKALIHVPTVAFKTLPSNHPTPSKGELVSGSVVVSIDYFKRFLANLRGFFGGPIKSYEPLLDRARREAMLRMKEDAVAKGAEMVINVRLETSSISKGKKGRSVGTVEVIAYGTALYS